MKKQRPKNQQILYQIKQIDHKVVGYYPIFTLLTGKLSTGILLCQLIFLHDKWNVKEFYQTNKELMDQTALGIDQLKDAKRNLIQQGWIETKIKSMPAKTYYKLNRNRIINAVLNYKKYHQPVDGEPANQWAENPWAENPSPVGVQPITSGRTTHHLRKRDNKRYNKRKNISHFSSILNFSNADSKSTQNQQILHKRNIRRAVYNYNKLAKQYNLPVCTTIKNQRQKKLSKRLRENGGLESWNQALNKIKSIPGLQGENNRSWKANIDFLLQPSSFVKLLEGYYDSWGNNGNSSHFVSNSSPKESAQSILSKWSEKWIGPELKEATAQQINKTLFEPAKEVFQVHGSKEEAVLMSRLLGFIDQTNRFQTPYTVQDPRLREEQIVPCADELVRMYITWLKDSHWINDKSVDCLDINSKLFLRFRRDEAKKDIQKRDPITGEPILGN
ncbi:MAG: hypothetical protein GWN01_09415 [Nitrosopumilaceae archaeon]|nr:hypothetical protein [Nitrosopumilaceae archaeon]NIU87827.1 hypothetical protein [Nitrosopumilaceae archaeon]NIV65209.1 hypothetical protein [Nitrosopumilaceae archaeon]NIX61725.1 hypothetical protein [Nitrosopumilaceae archaeon]